MRRPTKIVAGALASAALTIGMATSATANEPSAPTGNPGASLAVTSPAAGQSPMDVQGRFLDDGVRIRQSPGDGAVVGLGYRSQSVTAHCNVGPLDRWIYLTNNATGVTGYVYEGYATKANRTC